MADRDAEGRSWKQRLELSYEAAGVGAGSAAIKASK